MKNYLKELRNLFLTHGTWWKKWKGFVTVMAMVVVFVTTYALILPAITLEKDEGKPEQGVYLENVERGSTASLNNESTADPSETSSEEDPALPEDGSDEAVAPLTEGDDEAAADEKTDADNQSVDNQSVDNQPVDNQKITYAEGVYSAKGDGYTVFLDLKEEMKLPDDIRVTVEDITEDQTKPAVYRAYTTAVARAAKREGRGEVSSVRIFKVALFSGDKEIRTKEDFEVLVVPKPGDKIKNGEEAHALAFRGSAAYMIEDLATETSGHRVSAYRFVYPSTAGNSNWGLMAVAVTAPKAEDENNEASTELVHDEEKPASTEAAEEVAASTEETAFTEAEATTEKDEDSTEATEDNRKPAEKLSYKGEDYKVVMTCDEKSGIPEDAKLQVTEITEGSKAYKKYLKEARETLDMNKKADPKARFFDIKIMDGDKEIEPKTPVSVKISYDQPMEVKDGDMVDALHFGEKKTEVIEDLEVKTNKNDNIKSVTFDAESFSVYGVVTYTVDFTYDGYTYSINGNSTIKLSKLVEILGIVGKGSEYESGEDFVKDVENVTFSDESLVKVEKAGWFGTGVFSGDDWELISLKPFDTEETLTIEMEDGEKFVVKVTDAPADFNPSTYTSIEAVGHLEADLKEGTTVNYDAGLEEYRASVDSHFIINTNIVKEKKNFYVKLGPEITIPDNQLNVVKRADDKQAKMHAFNYYFTKVDDDYYMVVEYQDRYLNEVSIVRQGNVSMDLLVGKLDKKDEENSEFKFTDTIPITVPNNIIEYPENENENSDIKVDKSYGGMGTIQHNGETVTYLDYTVTVSSTKGTSENITLQDTLKNLTLELTPGGNQEVKVSDISIVSVTTSGHASGNGTLNKDVDNNSFTLTLNRINGGEGSYTVTYRYILDQEIPQELEEGQRRIYATGNNTIKAESGPIKHSDSDSFSILKENKPVTIEKNGNYNAETNKITWTITLTLKNGNHDLFDEMFADTNDLHVVKADGSAADYTQSVDKKTLHFPEAGTYTITYTTDAIPDAYTKYSVSNTAKAEDGTQADSTPVEIPRTDEGFVDKQFSMSELKSVSDGIEIYDLYWNVTFAVPESMRKGTRITDKVVLNRDWNDKLGYHEFTAEQQEEFLRLVNEAFGGTDLFTMNVTKEGSSVYEIILTLKEDYTKPAGVASMKSISYKTTAKIDLATANPGLVDGGATDTYKNTFEIGDLNATAQFNYKKEVNKIDVNHGRNGEKETNVTVKRSGDKTLVWAIVLNLQGDYNSMTVTDKLPAGLTVTRIRAGDQNNATVFEAPDFTKKHVFQPTNSIKSISANKTDDGTDLVIRLEEDEDRSDTFFKDGNRYYIYVDATVDDDQFDSLVNNVIEYTNNVSVTADGKNLGDDHQTQKTTLDSESIGKDTVKSAVSDETDKDKDWEKWHWLSYGVVINADGHEMNGGEPFAMEDVLSFNKYSPDGVEVSFALVPNSVRLEVKNETGEWVNYPGQWTYQFMETKDGDLRIKTLSLANLPDKTPLRLRYTYEVALDGNEPGKSYNIGDVKNIATIHGKRDYSIEHHENKEWEEFQSEASQTSSNTLNLSKVDLADYNTLLPGTKFVLEKWDGSQWVVTDAISQEADRYLTTETNSEKFDGTGNTQPITHENRPYTVYSTANLPNNRQHGTLQIYMPVPGLDSYNGPYFEAGVCYRAREYTAPEGNGYIVDENPDNQPAAYFYFSRDEEDHEVGAPMAWPNEKIKNLADDISKESDAFYITNSKEPSLKITKKFMGDAEITEAQKRAMTFDVYYAGEDNEIDDDDIKIKTLTYADILSNNNILRASDNDYGRYIKNKGVYYVIEHGIDLEGSNWTATYIVNSGVEENTEITDASDFDSKTTVSSGPIIIENNVGTIDFINKYDIPKTSIKVTKKWLNPDGSMNTDPDKKTIKFQVYQMEEGATKGNPYVPEGSSSAKTYEITYRNGIWSEVTVNDLPKFADSVNRTGLYSYYVVETDPSSAIQTTYKIGEDGSEGDAASAASADDTSPIVIVNKDTSVTVTKKLVDKLGNEKIPEDGATIKFKILGRATQKWDGAIVENIEAIGTTTLRYNATDQQWYKDGTKEVFNVKLPVEKNNCTFINYYIQELEANNYSVSYLINGLPQSDSNPIRNDENQTVTIVNAEKVEDGKIIVKKVWQNDQGEEVPAPNDINEINVKVKQVPLDIDGKGDPATIKVRNMYGDGERIITDFQVGDIVIVSLTASGWIGTEITGGKYKDLGNNQYEIIITEPEVVISVNGYQNITNINAARSSTQLPTEGSTKELNISKNHDPSWVSDEVSLKELFDNDENFNLYSYQIEESSIPSGYTVAYLYDGTYEENEMTGSVSGGLLTVYNTKSNGSLKLKKIVTVNEFTNGNSTLTNGTYTFNIVKPGPPRVTHEVKLTFDGGVITEALIDNVPAEADENGFYEVENLEPGDYVITEAQVTNGTTLSGISGGKGDGSPKLRTITVTVEAGKKGTEVAPEGTATFTNNINTATITVTKSVEKPEDLTLTQKFKIALKDNDGNYYKQNGTIATGDEKWIEFSTGGESKHWSNLPVGKTYTVEEDTVTAPTGYICVSEVSDAVAVEDAPYASGTATVTNRYQKTETEYSFKKIWLDSNGGNANKQVWPDGKNLGITLYRSASYKKTDGSDASVPEETINTYSIPIGGIESDNITVTLDESNTWYVVKFAKLEKYVPAEKLTDPEGDVEWEYYVRETTVPEGFSLQYGDEDGNGSSSMKFAKEGDSVINSVITVTLPSTGGPGPIALYILGLAIVFIAGTVFALRRKKLASVRSNRNNDGYVRNYRGKRGGRR